MTNPDPTKVVRQPRWLAWALVAATFILFAPALRYDYVDYDDGVYVYANKVVLNGLSAGSIPYAFTSIAGGSWMPLTWLSHMLDVEIFGPAPAGAHGMNVLLHAINAGLLLLALQRLTKQLWLSALVAAVFAFHPLRSESVAWISERKDVLSTLFFMLGLLAYVRYLELPTRKHLAGVVLCLCLGLMAKPMLVTFPFVLLLLDFWPLKRLGNDWPAFRQQLWPRVQEKLPLFIVVLLVCVATYWAQSQYGAVDQSKSPPGEHFTQVAGNYWFYVKKIFLPTGLNAIHPPLTTPLPAALLILNGFLAVTGLVLWRAFRQPWLVVGWFWFLGTLVPVVGLVRIGHISVAERYSYVPSIGLIIAIAWLVHQLIRDRIALQRAAGVVAAIILIAAALVTRADLPRWQNSLALFGAATRTDPHPVSYNNLAVYHLDRKDYAQALEPLTRAIALDPRYVKAYINRITAYQNIGQPELAKADLMELVKIEPRNAEGYNSRADVLLDLGRYDEAIADFTAAIKLSPDSATSYNNRGSAKLLKGEPVAALEDCQKAIALKPGYANAYNNLGNICQRTGDLSQALECYGKAIELAPGDPLAHNNRAAVYYGLKQYDQAWADLRRCEALGGTPHAGLVQALIQAINPTKPQ